MAAAPAARTYTLDFVEDNIVIHDGNGNFDTFNLNTLNPIVSGTTYNSTDQLITDQQKWNFLDAIKDGINKYLLTALKIYPKAADIYNTPNSMDTLHAYENELLRRFSPNLVRRTWTKTKEKSKMNYVRLHSYLWESGLGYKTFIEIIGEPAETSTNSIITFGSYIDPLSKPGTVWPPVNDTIILTSSLMKHTGFGESSIRARTIYGGGFDYMMNINCGEGCTEPNSCNVEYNGQGGQRSDPNHRLFAGNNEKNRMLKEQLANTALKTKTTVMKGWGDKIQVLIYFMYYHNQKKLGRDTRMITADMVVYSLCITLNIPCIYTGLYDRPVTIPTHDLAIGSSSLYSIVEFNPGTREEIVKQTYLNKMQKVYAENEETIASMRQLLEYPDTPIYIQGMAETFPSIFYEDVIEDMLSINNNLHQRFVQVRSNQQIIEILVNNIDKEIALIDLNFLIIPIIKQRGGKLIMLLGKSYLLDKIPNKPAVQRRNIINFSNNDTFYRIGREYKRLAIRTGGRRRQKGGASLQNQQILDFPTSDHTEKLHNYLRFEHIMNIQQQPDDINRDPNADAFKNDNQEKTINLQEILDRSFMAAFNTVFPSGNTVNLHETLYTLYIYECQMKGGSVIYIRNEDIVSLITSHSIYEPFMDVLIITSKPTVSNIKQKIKQYRSSRRRSYSRSPNKNRSRSRRRSRSRGRSRGRSRNHSPLSFDSDGGGRGGRRTHKKSNKRRKTHKRRN